MDEILRCKPWVLDRSKFTARKIDETMDLGNKRQITRRNEVQKRAQRLRCVEHLARTQWKSYGKLPDTRKKRKSFQPDPLAEDITRFKSKMNQSSTSGYDLPPVNEPGSYFMGGDDLSLSARAPLAPVRGMTATAQLLKKFGHSQQEPKILYDPHRTNKGQRCKYTNSMKMPADNCLSGSGTEMRDKILESVSNDAGHLVDHVCKTHSNPRKQVYVPLSKLRKFPTVSNISSGNGVLKVIYTKSKISSGGVPVVLPSFDFELPTTSCAKKQIIGNTVDYGSRRDKDIQRENTEVVMQNAEKLLNSPFKPEITSSQGSTDAKRTLSENPDPREVDRIFLDRHVSNQPYPDEIQNPNGKLIVWPKESSSANTADSIVTHKLPGVLQSLPETHVNLKHKVQDWIDNHLECSYSLE